jgi:hypothetical protein
MVQVDGVKVSALTWGDLTDRCRHEFRNSNPSSDVWLNCQKSAEVIVPAQNYMHWEGPNNGRFPNFERHEEMR